MPPWGRRVTRPAMSGSPKRSKMTLLAIRDEYRRLLSSLYAQDEIDDMFKRIIHFYFGWSPLKVGLTPHFIPDQASLSRLLHVLSALKKAEPLQYILGTTYFYGLKLQLNPSVLIPRPETEDLVAWVLEENKQAEARVWDLCTGSGCIALALKKAQPGWALMGVDSSTQALEISSKNATMLGLDIQFEAQDILCWHPQKTADIIVANPPYVLPSERVNMHPNVLDYEPALALFVPENDPLLFYRSILALGKNILREKGVIYFEINPLCTAELLATGKKQGYVHSIVKKDIFGKERFVKFST